MTHTFIVFKNLQKECVIDLDIKQLHHLGCDWVDNGQMFLHQSANILINLIEVVTNVAHLKTISNIQIPAHYIVPIPAKRTGKCNTTTPYIFLVETSEVISIQIPS